MKKLVSIFALAVVLVGIALTSPASASLGTVNIQGHNNALSDIGTIWDGGLTGVTGYTGVYSWTNAGGTLLGTQVPNWGFCTELVLGVYTGWHDVIPLDVAPNSAPMGTTKANYIRELWGRHFDPTWTAPGGNTQMAEAFGTAIWEIIYETAPWDVTVGPGFRAEGIEQYATANAWLNELDGTGPRACLVAISTPNGQDFVVPEPATVCLLGLGALGLLRRKK